MLVDVKHLEAPVWLKVLITSGGGCYQIPILGGARDWDQGPLEGGGSIAGVALTGTARLQEKGVLSS